MREWRRICLEGKSKARSFKRPEAACIFVISHSLVG